MFFIMLCFYSFIVLPVFLVIFFSLIRITQLQLDLD